MKLIFDNRITINPLKFNELTFKSKWNSNQLIQGYEFSLNVTNQKDYAFVQNDLIELSVSAEGDTRSFFVRNVQMKRSTTTNGQFVDADFEITICEKDKKPSFSEVDINGTTFQVQDYQVNSSDDVTIHSFLLTLDKLGFSQLEKTIQAKDSSINVKRLGIDDAPILCRVGGANYWSNQQEPTEDKIVRIVNCVIDHEPMPFREGFTSTIRSRNLEKKVGLLNMQVELLIKRLEGVLSHDDLIAIRSQTHLKVALNNNHEYWTELEQVSDAQEWFNANN